MAPAASGGFGEGAPFFRELEKLLSWQGGPINWELARQVAVQAASSESRPPDRSEQSAVREAGRLANHWLDEVTTLPGLSGAAEELASWSRTEWVERTLPVWQTICDPVAAKVVDAMGSGVTGGLASLGNLGNLDLSALELPEGMKLPEGVDLSSMLGELTGPLTGMLRQMGGLLFGAQVGQALSALANEVVGATDIGLPLGDPALLPHNVAVLAAGLEIPEDQVQLYVAVRELAHQRLFQHVPWLRGHLLGAVEEYARGITVDPEAIGRAVASIDPTPARPEFAGSRAAFRDARRRRLREPPVARAARRARPAGDGARACRGLGGRGDDGGGVAAPSLGTVAAGGHPAPAGQRRPGGADVRRTGRARVAPAAAT